MIINELCITNHWGSFEMLHKITNQLKIYFLNLCTVICLPFVISLSTPYCNSITLPKIRPQTAHKHDNWTPKR